MFSLKDSIAAYNVPATLQLILLDFLIDSSLFERNLSCHLSLRSTPEPHKDAFYLPFYLLCTQMLYLSVCPTANS